MSTCPYESVILQLQNSDKINADAVKLCNGLKITPKKSKLLWAYKNLISRGEITEKDDLTNYLKRKIKKGLSGITSVTVLTSPYPEIDGVKKEFSCKATDASYNVQPEKLEQAWNIRGLNNNSWHKKIC